MFEFYSSNRSKIQNPRPLFHLFYRVAHLWINPKVRWKKKHGESGSGKLSCNSATWIQRCLPELMCSWNCRLKSVGPKQEKVTKSFPSMELLSKKAGFAIMSITSACIMLCCTSGSDPRSYELTQLQIKPRTNSEAPLSAVHSYDLYHIHIMLCCIM